MATKEQKVQQVLAMWDAAGEVVGDGVQVPGGPEGGAKAEGADRGGAAARGRRRVRAGRRTTGRSPPAARRRASPAGRRSGPPRRRRPRPIRRRPRPRRRPCRPVAAGEPSSETPPSASVSATPTATPRRAGRDGRGRDMDGRLLGALASPATAASAKRSSSSASAGGSCRRKAGRTRSSVSRRQLDDLNGAADPVIEIKPWDPNTPYLQAMKAVAERKAYGVYLQQRKQFGKSPAFYLDCADYLLGNGRSGTWASAC